MNTTSAIITYLFLFACKVITIPGRMYSIDGRSTEADCAVTEQRSQLRRGLRVSCANKLFLKVVDTTPIAAEFPYQ